MMKYNWMYLLFISFYKLIYITMLLIKSYPKGNLFIFYKSFLFLNCKETVTMIFKLNMYSKKKRFNI